jgi:thiol:disulfide interchange protein
VAELIPLAVASAFWPILLVVVLVSLRAPHPVRLLGSFLAAALLTTVTVGLVIIYALQGTALVSTSRDSFDPAAQIVAGSIAIAVAILIRRRSSDVPAVESPASDSGRIEHMLERGAPLAFVAGIVLNLFPGFFPLIALKDIAELDEGFATTVALVLGFYVIMFALIEVPLVGYLVAPVWTAQATARFNVWLRENASRLAVGALGIVGLFLVISGLVNVFV